MVNSMQGKSTLKFGKYFLKFYKSAFLPCRILWNRRNNKHNIPTSYHNTVTNTNMNTELRKLWATPKTTSTYCIVRSRGGDCGCRLLLPGWRMHGRWRHLLLHAGSEKWYSCRERKQGLKRSRRELNHSSYKSSRHLQVIVNRHPL